MQNGMPKREDARHTVARARPSGHSLASNSRSGTLKYNDIVIGKLVIAPVTNMYFTTINLVALTMIRTRALNR